MVASLPATRAPGVVSFMRLNAAQHRRLAAAGRADERGDLVLADLHRHAAHRAERAVEDLDVLEVEHHRRVEDGAERRSGRTGATCGGRLGVDVEVGIAIAGSMGSSSDIAVTASARSGR